MNDFGTIMERYQEIKRRMIECADILSNDENSQEFFWEVNGRYGKLIDTNRCMEVIYDYLKEVLRDEIQ